MGLLDFLRDVGKHARVGTMLSRDSVRSRMELDNEGMSFTECAPAPASTLVFETLLAGLPSGTVKPKEECEEEYVDAVTWLHWMS